MYNHFSLGYIQNLLDLLRPNFTTRNEYIQALLNFVIVQQLFHDKTGLYGDNNINFTKTRIKFLEKYIDVNDRQEYYYRRNIETISIRQRGIQ